MYTWDGRANATHMRYTLNKKPYAQPWRTPGTYLAEDENLAEGYT